MIRLLGQAWDGWQFFLKEGKLAAVLLVALIYLGLRGAYGRCRHLYVYAGVMTAACIFPVTAAFLMQYQTAFYEYRWIFSLVPLTAVCAWGITAFAEQCWEGFCLKVWKRALPVTVLFLCALFLSAGPGGSKLSFRQTREEREHADSVIEQLVAMKEDVCLWAPREILQYAREQNGEIRLLYGRNMWERELDGYSYDTVSESMKALYRWMEGTDPQGNPEPGEGETTSYLREGESCMAQAARAGANCVLLPDSLEEDAVRKLAQAFEGSVTRLDEYYLVTR